MAGALFSHTPHWSGLRIKFCDTRAQNPSLPRQQKINEMNGAHLVSPIRGELGYAHWPQLGTQFIAILGTKFGPHYGNKMFALTAAKFLFSNSGNFRAKANPPKLRSCPKRQFGQ